MKLFLLLPLLFVSNLAFANTVETVFRKNSPLPLALKTKILQAIEAQCPQTVDGSPVHIEEISTQVRVDRVDQGIRDVYFTTELRATFEFQFHPITHSITVRSLDADINNPMVDRYEVREVHSSLCK